MFCVKIVNVDFYMSNPVDGLDVRYSEFRSASVNYVPVIRIFGSSPTGKSQQNSYPKLLLCYLFIIDNCFNVQRMIANFISDYFLMSFSR